MNCNDAHTLISLRSLSRNFALWGTLQKHKCITKPTTNNKILERRIQFYWLQDYNTCRKTTCQKKVLWSGIPSEFLPTRKDLKMPNQQTSHLHKFLPSYIILHNYLQLFKHLNIQPLPHTHRHMWTISVNYKIIKPQNIKSDVYPIFVIYTFSYSIATNSRFTLLIYTLWWWLLCSRNI